MSVVKEPFGRLPNDSEVFRYIIGDSDLKVAVLSYGATIQSIQFGGKDCVLGYDTLKGYLEGGSYQGATVGRYAGRIAGGCFSLNGKSYDVGCNENGTVHLHGGFRGFDKHLWNADVLEDGVRFFRVSPDGEEGFPGTLQVSVTIRVHGSALCLSYEATASADTPLNLTNHCYFNLNGYDGGDVLDTRLCIAADCYLPVDKTTLIPTGELREVGGTAFDFRMTKPIGQDLDMPDDQLRDGYDHTFVLWNDRLLRVCARAESPRSGIGMEMSTDLPSVQFYTANSTDEPNGKGGLPLRPHTAFCLETQFYPDSPHHPEFPSCILHTGETFRSETKYRFFKL